MISPLHRSFTDAVAVLQTFVEQQANIEVVQAISDRLTEAFNQNKKAVICGNGGSACDAMHFAEEFTGRYRMNRRPLPVISLTDSSHITCVANDYGFDHIFSRGVEAYGQEGDLLFALSTSGNSSNIIEAEIGRAHV